MISWICCSQCTLWYHTDCVRVDMHYANDIPYFICSTCVRNSKNGIFNFAYRLRNYNLHDMKGFDLLKEWGKLDDSLKEQIKQHTFPAINSVDVAVGPLEILSQRGLRNKYNNCWSNAAFQLLAGSVVSRLLPHPRNCPSEICRDIHSVVRRLQANSYGTLPFTSDMKNIVKIFFKRDQTIIHKQEDACELIEFILGDLCENSIDDTSQCFSPVVVTILSCLTCKASMAKPHSDHIILPLNIENILIKDMSIQSLIWNWTTNVETYHLTCSCVSENQRQITARSLFLHLPTVLFIMTDRIKYKDGRMLRIPLHINETLNLEHALSGKVANQSVAYRLAAVLSHYGRGSKQGHYFCTVLSDNGSAITFDDQAQQPTSVDDFLKSNKCKTSSKLLVYIRADALQSSKPAVTEPWHCNITNFDIKEIENIWFGCSAKFDANDLTLENFRSLVGNQPTHPNILCGFLRSVASSRPDKDIEILPLFTISHILENVKMSSILSTALSKRLLFSNNDLVLFPCYRKETNHWSMASIYPKHKLVVHCDTLPDKDWDKVVFTAIATYLGKVKLLNQENDNRKEWAFLPLHEYGLQKQLIADTDMLFACIFAHCFVYLEDFHMEEADIPQVKYWIAMKAKHGVEIGVYFENASSAWEDNVVSAFNVSVAHRGVFPDTSKPFTNLSNILKRISRLDEDSSDSDDNEGFLHGNLQALFKGKGRIRKIKEQCADKTLRKSHDDFIEYCLNEITGFLAIMRKIKDGYQQATENFSERVYVLATYYLDTFKSIAQQELEGKISPAFGRRATKWAVDDLSIHLTRMVKDRDSPTKDKLIYKYDLECGFGLNHEKFIKWLIFPELLTRFFMSKYSIDFKTATGRIYGSGEPTQTLYFKEIKAIERS